MEQIQPCDAMGLYGKWQMIGRLADWQIGRLADWQIGRLDWAGDEVRHGTPRLF